MQSLGSLGPFDRNLEEWPAYCERVILYLDANKIEEDVQRRAVFLSACGSATYQLIRSLVSPSRPTEKSLDELFALVKEHLTPTTSTIIQCYIFNGRSQKEGESVAEFVAELRHIAQLCNFGPALEDMLRDRLVCGLRDDRVQRRLLAEPRLTLAKAFEVAQASEMAEKGVRALQPPAAVVNVIAEPSVEEVYAVKTKSGEAQTHWERCFRCGGRHSSMKCRDTEVRFAILAVGKDTWHECAVVVQLFPPRHGERKLPNNVHEAAHHLMWYIH